MNKSFEVLQVDAWADGDGWVTNDANVLGYFSTKGNPRRALIQFLKEKGITFNKGAVDVEDDGDYLTVVERKSRRPLFDARYEWEVQA